jgi:glycosyltransferase involved in cell wall biosynthesis
MTAKVSVLTTTYNHERYIAQAMDSVLAQQTDFSWEQIIGEDCSTDGTRPIVQDYQRRYPDQIKPILREHNVGRRQNFLEAFSRCQGDYIAILEGDDYWTSPLKLQRQVDFLDAHPDHAICFHAVEARDESGVQAPKEVRATRGRYTLEDLLEQNIIPTCSVLFRNRLFASFPDWYLAAPAGDWPLHVLNAHHGAIGYIDELMAVYRIHAGGVWSPQASSVRRRQILLILELFYRNLDSSFKPRIEQSLARWHFKTINALLIEKNYRGAADYTWKLLASPGIPRQTLLQNLPWALRGRLPG